jgi:hypothetical protein
VCLFLSGTTMLLLGWRLAARLRHRPGHEPVAVSGLTLFTATSAIYAWLHALDMQTTIVFRDFRTLLVIGMWLAASLVDRKEAREVLASLFKKVATMATGTHDHAAH